jgi:colanic acid/amylovoran biosynthesis glycosyltransferase
MAFEFCFESHFSSAGKNCNRTPKNSEVGPRCNDQYAAIINTTPFPGTYRTMTLRIAYLCGEYPRATDTFIQREVASLRASGACVETIAVRRPVERERGTEEQAEERKRTHYLLPCSPFRLIMDHLTLMARSPIRYLQAIRIALSVRAPGVRSLCFHAFYFAEAGLVAARLIRQGLSHLHNHSPDSSGFVTLLAAQLADCTYSFTLHGFGILTEPGRWRLTEKLEGALFVICISQFARSQAMLWSHRSQWSRYHVVHCGVAPKLYKIRDHSGQGSRLLFVGRLDFVKGLPILLEAFAALVKMRPGIYLDIVGDGPQRTELSTLTEQLGLSSAVSFHGYLSQRLTRRRLVECDVVVMSSFYEGIPVVLIEAMASGIPVVAPRITGIPELVEDGVSGFLTACGDVNALADRIGRLLDSGDLRQRFGEAGRTMVEREFNLDIEIGKLTDLFQRYLGNKNPS